MSRYTGPRLKIMRALGLELPGLSKKSIENRPYAPGQHGQKPKRRSDFANKLVEKQKLKFNYGLTERQMRRTMSEARRIPGNTGATMLQLLERRLDNVVFRAGFAPTAIAARQLVGHRHVLLNGKVADIPSIRTKPGDQIQLRGKANEFPIVIESLANPPLSRPEWISFNTATRQAQIARTPMADETPFPIEIQQVVEYYSGRL